MPRRRLLSRVHALAGTLAFLIILAFLATSAWAEIAGGTALIARVKTAIAWGLLALVPALAATGASGFFMAGSEPKGIVATKLMRMKIVAANGLVVLVPCALFLSWKAGTGTIDATFAAVQALEFLAGVANLSLMGLNMRDGLRLTGKLRRAPAGHAERRGR